MNLTDQEQKVYDFILKNRGATTHDIQFQTWVSCPSARITEINKKARMENLPEPIISIGKKKFGRSRPFEMYAIRDTEDRPMTSGEKEIAKGLDALFADDDTPPKQLSLSSI
jgi:hypothetical protein